MKEAVKDFIILCQISSVYMHLRPHLARGWLDQVSSSRIRELSRDSCPLEPSTWLHLRLLAHFIAKTLSEFNKNIRRNKNP